MTLQPLPQVIDPEHLTQAFRRSGILGDARVADVAVESSRAPILSQITRLRLAYDSGAPDAPYLVILKTGHLNARGTAGPAGAKRSRSIPRSLQSLRGASSRAVSKPMATKRPRF